MSGVSTFTCMGDWHGAPVVPVGRKEWEEARRKPQLAELCRLIEAGDEKQKRRLPVWTPHCAEFRDNHRAIADAVRPLRRLMLDFDEKGHTDEILSRSMELLKEGRWNILLVEESVRRGTHVLIELPPEMTAEDAQKRFSEDVGFVADAALKDVARCIYLVSEEHTRFVSEALFEADALYLPDSSPSCQPERSEEPECTTKSFPTTFKDIPYRKIIDEWFRRKGGTPVEGERNEKLFRLAVQLRCITDSNEAHLLEILPRFGLDETEMKAIIHSACVAKYSGMSRLMEGIIASLHPTEKAESVPTEDTLSAHYMSAEAPPPMPPVKRLPPLIRLLLSNTPDIYRPAVAHAVFPPLGAHLWRTYFPYIDNVLHEATFMNVLIAPTASGKSCINEPLNYIMADIRQRDAESALREKEWKEEVQSKGANKDKRKRPEGLVIQEIDADMTNAAFVRRLADADGKFLYTRMNEIEQFDALKTSSRSKVHFQIMCLAFDPGNTYGQVRVGLNSVCERVCIRFNWNASTTVKKGQAYFRSVVTDGPISRINFCTIPEMPIGSPMPVYGIYGPDFAESLRPYIERLNSVRGVVECKQAQKLAKVLMEENADFARLSQSRVFENLSYRANVIAYLKGCLLYVANDMRWDKSIEEFVRWSLQYDMYVKMKYFGQLIEDADTQEMPAKHRPGPRNLLDFLPDVFTHGEAGDMRRSRQITGGSLSVMLANWKSRGFIEPLEEDANRPKEMRRYRKTEEYLQLKICKDV